MKMNILKLVMVLFTLLVILLQDEKIFSQESNIHDNKLDWNQWRGPNRDGLSNEKDILKQWPENGPEIQWRIPVGDGFSGISIIDEKLFTMWDEKRSQLLVCLEAQSGKELWRYRVDDNYESGWGDGPLITPLIDNNTVYVVSTNGQLHAVDIKSGKSIWSQDLSKSYGYESPPYGFSPSPLIENEKLFIQIGGQEDFSFVALNKNTGELIWHSQTDEPAYSSPIIFDINETRQIVFMSAKGLFAVSPEDGELFWMYDWESRCPASGISLNAISPIFIHPDKIFISGGFGTISGGALIQITEHDDKFTVNTLWYIDDMSNAINSSVFVDAYIYGFDQKKFKCIDASTGDLQWETLGFQDGSLIVVDGHIIALGANGNLALIEVNPEKYIEISNVKILDGRCWTPPTLADGKLYLRNHEEMVCLKIK